MRPKEMHPLCCITLESPGVGSRSPAAGAGPPTDTIIGGSDGNAGLGAAGVLYKWTNYRKRWRPRWFLLINGLLSYSKIRRLEHLELLPPAEDLRVIGNISGARLARLDGFGSRRRHDKTDENGGAVHLQISSFRESRSDDNRFYIFTATKKLHLRADSKRDRVAWIEALSSTRSLYLQRPVNGSSSLAVPNDIGRISTEKLKNRLRREGGISEALVEDCEQIMLLEFSQAQGKLKVLREERSALLDTVRQLEEANIEAEGSSTHESDRHLVQGKCSVTECSTTESSDDIDKHDFDEVSDEGEAGFFDTEEHFSEPTDSCAPIIGAPDQYGHGSHDKVFGSRYPLIERRTKLPDPVEKEKGISLWSMIKDNVGKDLTRVCLPVYSNEPISSLQKCFEDLEYSYLLDQAYEYGKAGNSLLRALKVAGFAVSGYASSEARHCKPFNALLGETYEADYPDKGVRFFSEKVCHHPTLIAFHCEGKGWKLWGDSNLHAKFWGTSIQLDPIGVLNLEFDDGEVFQWSKVTTTIYNLIIGKVYCDHHGVMQISGNRQYSCKLKFKEQSLIDRNPHQVDGFVEDDSGNKAATLFGKWDDCIYFINGDRIGKSQALSSGASLLWQRNKLHSSLTLYNFTPFAITFNELTPLLKGKLPPTDSRLRPDQRHLENGEYEKAYAEKRRLEGRQRMSSKLQERGWRPRWFAREGVSGAFRYVGGYWEAREPGKWDGCANIFGDFDGDAMLIA